MVTLPEVLGAAGVVVAAADDVARTVGVAFIVAIGPTEAPVHAVITTSNTARARDRDGSTRKS
jgi:hypothetical protein